MSSVIKRAVGRRGNNGDDNNEILEEEESGDYGGDFNRQRSKVSPLSKKKNKKESEFGSIPVLPRKSIRQYSAGSAYSSSPSLTSSFLHQSCSSSLSSSFEDSYLLYRGKKTMFTRLVFYLTSLLTWIQKLFIKYSHNSYLTSRISLSLLVIVSTGLLKDYFLDHPQHSSLESIRQFLFSIKTAKTNPLNVYFVKLGWLWTFISLIPFLIFTRCALVKRLFEVKPKIRTPRRVTFQNVESVKGDSGKSPKSTTKANQEREEIEEEEEEIGDDGNLVTFARSNQIIRELAKEMFPPFFRLLITTLIWYYSVDFFEYLGNSTGSCRLVKPVADNSTEPAIPTNRKDCLHSGNQWSMGFDISGHIFLMTFSNLIRIEEFSYLLQQFDEFSQFRYLNRFGVERAANFASPYRFEFQSLFKVLAFVLSLLVVLVTFVWDFMSLQTSLFYHTLLQKICGFVWALVGWLLTYRLLFANNFLRV